ncbi:MAG: type 3 domain protein [Xanthobacteraceae bacterium]|jgi:hypothetical protein|nr:type 3 domain protein [Xanthobacteraceae bacterium]
MRSALKRDLDVRVVPQQADESGAPAEGQANLVEATRGYARPRIVEREVRNAQTAAPDAAVPEDSKAMPPAGAEPAEAVDGLLSDLQRIMASLDAQRQADAPRSQSVPVAPSATAASSTNEDAPLGSVAAAALRAFREAEAAGQRHAPSVGARLITEEAARIAVERRHPPGGEVPPEDLNADMLLASPSPSDAEPYVYTGGEPVAPPEATETTLLTEPPPSDDEDPIRDFVPPRHRTVQAATEAARSGVSSDKAGTGGFAFDINAFVDELERETADAGRELSGEDAAAVFAGGRALLDASKTLPPAAADAEAAETTVEMPSVEAAIARALAIDESAETNLLGAPSLATPSLETPSLATWEPDDREAAAPAVTPPPARHVRTDTFTWKRFALLGVIVVGAIGAGVALQSVAARNDMGAVPPEGSAAVASVAPQGDGDAPATAMRNVTPKAADQVAQDAPAPAVPATPSAELAMMDQPVDQPMEQALSGEGRDASAVATPDVALAPGESEAPAPQASAEEVQASGAEVTDAPASEAPADAVPVPAPRAAAKPTLAAATSATRTPIPGVSNAAPSGTATIKSGVTMRSGPDNKAGAVGTLKTGQKVDLVACKLWCEVVADGKRGFVFKKFVEAGAPEAGAPAQ